MIKGYYLIQKFEKQNRNTIWKQLASIGKKAEIYSDSQVGIMPYLGENTFYIYAVYHSLVVVCLDNCPPREELADEEPFNDGQPLYFTEDSHRVSPVWQLSETIKLIKKQLEDDHDYWTILGVLLTESSIINAGGIECQFANTIFSARHVLTPSLKSPPAMAGFVIFSLRSSGYYFRPSAFHHQSSFFLPALFY